MNFYRYECGWGQEMPQDFTSAIIEDNINLGRYGAKLYFPKTRTLPTNVWVRDDVLIKDTISIKEVNGQLFASPEEDKYSYFWVSGKRGISHNSHKRLLLPPAVEVLAAGGEEAHTQGNCNCITHAIFRVPFWATEIWCGDMLYGEYSHAIRFKKASKIWYVESLPYERFCALNPEWKGEWAEGSELPIPSLLK